MKRKNKRIRMLLMTVIILGGMVTLFLGCASQFGARATGDSLQRVQSSAHFTDGTFQNLEPTFVNQSKFGSLIKWIMGTADGIPDSPLSAKKFDKDAFLRTKDLGVVWFGHSTVLLNLNGHIVLTDPVFSKNASPLFFGNKAFDYTVDASAEELPDIDVVVISHDHYDHLDMQTIKELKNKTKVFLVPLGVAAHLIRWGIDKTHIVELDWDDHYRFDDKTEFIAAPSRHFSGRSLFDLNSTLWCSWVIKSGARSVFFSGDSGYGSHFKKIGKDYGPFDLALLECGQYNKNWPFIHMDPKETLLAFDDLGGNVLLPIHWGKFKLSLHAWNDPAIQVIANKGERKVLIPVIGAVAAAEIPVSFRWWDNADQDKSKNALIIENKNSMP
jgi:L-ascorbate metabolism protein UlaG (beta-lactamase superfamily)